MSATQTQKTPAVIESKAPITVSASSVAGCHLCRLPQATIMIRWRVRTLRSCGLGDFLQHFTTELRLSLGSDIADRNNADQFAIAVQHRQTPNLLSCHYQRGTFDIVILETIHHRGSHGLANEHRFRISLGSQYAYDQAPIC